NVVFGYENPSQKNSFFRLLNWDNFSYQDFVIPLQFPHYVKRNSQNPDEFFVIDFYGSMVKLNIVTKEYLMVDHKIEKNFFQGHGVQTADGERLLTVESNSDNSVFSLVARSSKTLEKLDVIASYGNMHHIVNIPNSTMVAYPARVNADGASAIYFYDYQKKSHVQVVNTDFDFPSHLTVISPTEMIFPTARTNYINHGKLELADSPLENVRRYDSHPDGRGIPSPLYHLSLDGTKTSIWDESQKDLMCRGISAVYMPKTKKMITSFLGTNSIALWRENKIQKVINVKRPLNLLGSLDETEFIAYASAEGILKVYSAESLEEIQTISLGRNHRICSLTSYT
ncbi:MAG: hypothetical protein ACXWPX_10625, partial [Pseudobdellovibrio sp.]